jgi:outer membrane lipoprotein SlyB
MRRPIIIISLLALLALAGCQCNDVPGDYVAADRATYEVIAPMYSTYVQADDSLSANDAEAFLTLLETWAARIEAQEEDHAE